MKKRNLYNLEQHDDCVVVFRTDNNYGRLGVVFDNGVIRKDSKAVSNIPQYIYAECMKMFKIEDVILKNEGEFISISFKTAKSKQSTLYNEVSKLEFFNKENDSFAIAHESKNNIISLLVSYNLTSKFI